MELHKIDSFASFCLTLREVGFSMGGSNGEGIFSLNEFFSPNLVAHTGNMETDPWEWRIRGVLECKDLAYAKVFFNKGGWITKDWYPYFMAVRRDHKTFEQMYRDGLISDLAKQVYHLIRKTPSLALHEIKVLLDCDKSQSSKLEAALTQLQMKMLITINGQKYKLSKDGNAYGWPVTTFCTAEEFFGEDIYFESCSISKVEAVNCITDRILSLNPTADCKSIHKFIGIMGR